MTTTLDTLTEDTAFVITDAGLDALRTADAQGMAESGATEAGDGFSAPALTTEAPQAEAGPERWMIDSESKANWYLRKVRQAEDEIATVKAQAAAMVRALESDLNRLNARHEADFHAWAKNELARQGKGKKTLPLFQGTVAFRTVPASLRVCGSAQAIEYARSQGWDVVKTVESLDSDGYKREATAALAQSGEVLPGIEIIPAGESVSVRFGRNSDPE